MDSAEEQMILDRILAEGQNAPGPGEKIQMLARLCEHGSDEAKRRAAEAMVIRITRLGRGLREARAAQAKLAEMVEELTSPPWHPWAFRGICPTSRGDQALVSCGGKSRIVGVAEGVNLGDLLVGDEVFLGQEMNMIMDRSPWGPRRCGETAVFDRLTSDGRLVIKWRDEEFVVEAAGALNVDALKPEDEIRWNRTDELAYEKIERAQGEGSFLEETPDVAFEDVGGLDEAIGRIKRAVTLHMKHPEIVERLVLDRVRTILLEGPPGGHHRGVRQRRRRPDARERQTLHHRSAQRHGRDRRRADPQARRTAAQIPQPERGLRRPAGA